MRPHMKVEKHCNIIVIPSEGITWNWVTDQEFVKMNSKNGFVPLTGKTAAEMLLFTSFTVPLLYPYQ